MTPPRNGLSEYLGPVGDLPPPAVWQHLNPATWATELTALLAALSPSRPASDSPQILVLTGKAGSGKSTLGRWIRKRGLPGHPPGDLLVIDDGMAHLKWFGIIPRRIRHRSGDKDYLDPFAGLFRGRRLLVYVNTHPEKRIDRCDLLLRLGCAEDERESRLLARDPDGAARFASTREQTDLPRIRARCYAHLATDHPDWPLGRERRR